jgi:hypothetical protein
MRMAEGPESQVQLFPENLPADLGGHSCAWRVCLCRKPSADEPKDGVIGLYRADLGKAIRFGRSAGRASRASRRRHAGHSLCGVRRNVVRAGRSAIRPVHRFRNRLRLSAS